MIFRINFAILKKQSEGFTLVDMLVTTAITAVIVVIATNFLINGFNIQRYVNEQNDAIVQTRHALDIMTRELREAIAADTGSYPIESVTNQEIIFYGDIDNDQYTERIRYFLNGTQLQRGVTEPTGYPLTYNTATETITTFSQYIQNGSSPVFYYYNENYPQDTTNNPLSTPIDKTEIRLIRINVLTNVDPNRVPDTRELDTFIQLRNLKENF